MKYIALDTETTGLDPSSHELLSFGAVVMIDDIVVERFVVRIKPEAIERASREALEVNGYTPRKWRDAHPMNEGADLIRDFFARHDEGVLVAHNIRFDFDFIRALSVKVYGSDDAIRVRYPYIDTRDISRAVLAPYGLQSMSLDNICKFLGWRRRNAHTALSDCEDCIRLVRAICPPSPRFILRLNIMNTIRNLKDVL